MRLLIHQQGLDRTDKIQLIISYLLQLVLLGAIILSLYEQQWLNAFAVFGILFLTFLPKMFRHTFKVFLPIEFDFLAILFIFTAIFLGEVHSYYTIFWWWDLILHSSSGFLLGIAGFLAAYILNEEKKIHLKMKPAFVALFAFLFALAIGVLWEIFEFFMDSAFGLNMQASGVTDTMWDLIVDVLGAAVIAVLGYFYIRRHKILLFDRMIHRFVQRNPQLFRQKIKIPTALK